MMKKRCGVVKTYEDWRKPKLVSNALELLDYEIPRYKSVIKYVQLCFSTDPFMQEYPEVKILTLNIIRKLNAHNIRCSVLTKGIIPYEIGNEPDMSRENEYGVSIVSLDEGFRSEFEPYTSNYEERLNSLKYLSEQGLKTWVSIEPYPTPNILEQNIVDLLKRITFADRIIFGRLNYNSSVTKYASYKIFYNKMAKIVIEFCKELNISYYIKEGTVT
jgi:DNA repair photolyase